METIYLIIVLEPAGSLRGCRPVRQADRPGGCAHHHDTRRGHRLRAVDLYTLLGLLGGSIEPFNGTVYQWMAVGGINMEVGFLVDNLTAMMMVVVTFVSLMVHIYTIGYMHDDPGYQRFFSYISLFTFAMLMLVMANNFLQLFFGWEAVGLVSYLLIGFWYKRPTAIFANMKAFLVNRVGDFGFLLGIAALLMFTGSLDYAETFAVADQIAGGARSRILGDSSWSLLTVACICLFIGAMGKSAQVPLHVWLPDSMEGPTPISALIHAATMVTAGCVHGGAHVAAVRAVGNSADLRDRYRRDDGVVHRFSGPGAERHQARGRVLDAVAAGLHDGSARCIGLCSRRVSPDDARVLQGVAVPGCRFGHYRSASRAGHAQDGRLSRSTCPLPTGRVWPVRWR